MHPECTSINCIQDIFIYFSSSFVGHKVVEGCERLPFDPMLLGGCYLATMLFFEKSNIWNLFQTRITRINHHSKVVQNYRKRISSSIFSGFLGSGNRPPIIRLQIRVVAAAVLPGALRANGNVGTSGSEGQSFQGAKFSSP